MENRRCQRGLSFIITRGGAQIISAFEIKPPNIDLAFA